MNIRDFQHRAWKTSEDHGFHETAEDRNFAAKVMLIACELAEAVEEYRNGKPALYYDKDKPEGIGIELADAVVRIGDLCGMENIDLESMLEIKMAYNDTRPHRHGNKLI